jgi:ADP-ribosyl-[dinitrogen reductase] hydrolase
MNEKDYILGAVFGEAIGDALGHPIEFKKTHKVVKLEEKNQFTDDTQMFCAIGEALLDAPPHIDEEAFMQALAKRFDEWRHHPLGGTHRAPGGNCMDAVRKLGAGVHWTKAGGLDFKGNGSAMRSGVVGAMYWKNPEYAFRIGALSSACTHNNLESLLGAGMVAFLVASCINQGNWAVAVSEGLRLCGDFANTIPFYPQQVAFGNKFNDQSPWYALSRWGSAFALGTSVGTNVPDAVGQLIDRENIVVDGAVVPAVAEAIFFNTRFTNFPKTVLTAVNNSDDADTIGAISGTIAGARYGYEGISLDWTSRIELPNYLLSLGERLYEASEKYVIELKAAEETTEEIDYDELFADGEIVLDEIPDGEIDL